MYLVALIPGKMLFFAQFHISYLDLLEWALSIGIATFVIVATIRSRRNTPIKPIRPNPMGSIPTHLLRTKGARIGKTALALVLGMAIGWAWKSHEDRSVYLQEHEAWKQRSAEIQRLNAGWRADYAVWTAKQKENR